MNDPEKVRVPQRVSDSMSNINSDRVSRVLLLFCPLDFVVDGAPITWDTDLVFEPSLILYMLYDLVLYLGSSLCSLVGPTALSHKSYYFLQNFWTSRQI